MKEKAIYWLFDDGSTCYIKGRPFRTKAIAFKLEYNHTWNYNMEEAPENYFG